MISRERTLLRAGAILPPDAALPEGEPRDLVSARAYTHPALPDRVVVRLSAGALSRADDVEMSLLGFAPPSVTESVGLCRRRAVGFPGDVLIKDPERAAHALDVVKDLKKQARRARSKPGHARDGFDAIAARLGRTVPHFLPSFWEEAGRAFLEAGARSFAASAFGKAREAEKVHALAIDEDLRREVFLEFALAGALTNKVLSEYARDLEKAWAPDVAWHHFRELAVRRTLGGMPPWSGMAKDLRRLAKAARLDGGAEDARLVEELLQAPSLKSAATDFWTSYQGAIVALGQRSAEVRRSLLDLFPKPSSDPGSFHPQWLQILQDAGCVAAMVAGEMPAGYAATWVMKLSRHFNEGWRGTSIPPAFYDIVRALAARLVADAVPVVLGDAEEGWWGSAADPDLLELFLSLGVPLADPDEHVHLDLKLWADRKVPVDGFPSDPVLTAADPRFSKLLVAAVEEIAGGESFEKAAVGKAGLTQARRAFLQSLAQRLTTGCLVALDEHVETLTDKTQAVTFTEFPDCFPAFEEIDPARNLLRTLREGVLDELGWPALEAACEELDPKGEGEVSVSGSFPCLVLQAHGRVVVLKGPERVLDTDLKLPKKVEFAGGRYVGGQLLVVVNHHAGDDYAFWSGSPSQTFEANHWRWSGFSEAGVDLPDGSVSWGQRAFHPGDTQLPEPQEVLCDGTTFWRVLDVDDETRLGEFDPRTGEKGRLSLPRFLEDFVAEGHTLRLGQCGLLPAPACASTSPLGWRDGLVGFRVRVKEEDDQVVAETIDGCRFSGRVLDGDTPVGLLRFPGDPRPRPLVSHWRSVQVITSDGAFVLAEADEERSFAAGTPVYLARDFWHFLVPRDPAASARLRALAEDDAQTLALLGSLMDLADEEREGADDEDTLTWPRTAARVAQDLGVSHPRLARGLAALVARAAASRKTLRDALEERRPSDREAGAPISVPEPLLGTALVGLVDRGWWSQDHDPVRVLSAFFAWALPSTPPTEEPAGKREAGRIPRRRLAEANLDLTVFAGCAGALARVAACPGVTAEGREALAGLLELWAGLPLVAGGARLRRFVAAWPETPAPECPFRASEDDGWYGLQMDGSRYLVSLDSNWRGGGTVKGLEMALDGTFRLLPGLGYTSQEDLAEPLDSAALHGWARALRDRGALPFQREHAARLAEATGLSRGEASLLLAGLPGLRDWDKNFLDKDLRTSMDLKVVEAAAARDSLRSVQPAQVRQVLAAALPASPQDLWDQPGEAVDLLARAWVQAVGRRVPIPDDIALAAGKEIGGTEPLLMVAAPGACGALNRDGRWRMDEDGDLVRTDVSQDQESEGGEVFDEDTLDGVVKVLPWLFERLPVGDPLRANLPQVWSLALERLDNPDLLFKLGTLYLDDDEKKATRARSTFLDLVGGEPFTPRRADPDSEGEEDEDKALGRDNGTVVVVAHWSVDVAFRPARVAACGATPDVDKLCKAMGEAERASALFSTRLLRSQGYALLMDRVRQSPVPAGRYEADPLASVPTLVAHVQKKCGLGEDGAVLYLQTLALRAPTSKDVQAWNGWTPSRYKKAAAECVERKLLLEARRSRAGRSHFLPGAWLDLKAPDLPMEAWKMPLYDIARDRDGTLTVPLLQVLPLEPLHAIFERAWGRIEAGDMPRYEEVE